MLTTLWIFLITVEGQSSVCDWDSEKKTDAKKHCTGRVKLQDLAANGMCYGSEGIVTGVL